MQWVSFLLPSSQKRPLTFSCLSLARKYLLRIIWCLHKCPVVRKNISCCHKKIFLAITKIFPLPSWIARSLVWLIYWRLLVYIWLAHSLWQQNVCVYLLNFLAFTVLLWSTANRKVKYISALVYVWLLKQSVRNCLLPVS